MPGTSPVLVSWCAKNNDPYERDRDGSYQLKNGNPLPGPTLTLLFDRESPYANTVEDVVLLYNEPPNAKDDTAARIAGQTIDAIQGKKATIRCERHKFITSDPTDHREIFKFLERKLPEIRRKYQGRELLIHISPGTPSMQTIWVLMAECGFIEPPYKVVKSYRASERGNRTAVVPVDIGIETFYKVYRESRPSRSSSSETEFILWDPALFRSSKLVELYAEARRYAQLRVPVLITGERGTGKTTLANWIRINSRFCKPQLNRNWASVPCGQYNQETMRSELFGYVKGAFTGADTDRDGLLRTADGDTLFLDEIGDISRDLQRLLIRAVEEGCYYRLGSTTPEKSSFRLITATNLELSELKKRVDPDFFDRISTLQLRVPALREIPEDLPWLWESTFNTALQRSGAALSNPEIHEKHVTLIVGRFRQYSLDGNLRDLFRVANRLIANLCATESGVKVDDAIEAAFRGQFEPDHDVALEVAKAFCNGSTLDHVLTSGSRLTTVDIETKLRLFMASELRRIARLRGLEVADICDVSERTLRAWANADHRKQTASSSRKNPADIQS